MMFITAVIIVYGTVTPFAGKLSLIDVSSVLNRDETLTGTIGDLGGSCALCEEEAYPGAWVGGVLD